jgi:hypothetical protein
VWAAAALAAAAVAGCGEDREAGPPRTSYSYEPPAQPLAAALLRADTLESRQRGRRIDLDVLMPPATEAAARATLQHVIDSVAAADTLAVAIRATGFLMGAVDPASASAEIEPAMRAVWAPPDSVWGTGARRGNYRTQFTVLRPFDSTRVAPAR